MNTSRLCALRVGTVLLLAGLAGLAPPNARGQFATLLDTTSRYAGNSTGTDPFNGDTGVATATSLNVPSYVVFDSLGDLYISDTLNNCVRKVDTSGNITTVAGLRINGGPDTCNTTSNPAPDPTQGLLAPTGLAIDGSNTLYIADSQHNCVRSLASGAVDSYATPSLNRVAGTCTFVNTSSVTPVPDGLAVDSSSNLYISIVDSLTAVPVYQVVRHLASDPATTICAVAGETSANAATTLCPGIANTVKLVRPAGLVFDKNGNLFIADSGNDCVREIAGMTTQQTAVGQCINDLTGSTATVLNNPYGLSFSSDASLYISESALTQNNIVSFNSGSNTLSPIAGRPSGLSGPYNVSQEGQPALLVPLNQPLGITSDTGGSVYIADSQNNVVRKMSRDLSFPNTIVGQTSPTQIILFSINQTVNLTVTVGTDYNLVSSSCRGPLASASVGQPPNTCQVVVSFTPSRSGFRYSALQLRDSISGQLLSVELEGVGIGPLSLLAPGVASSVTSGLRTAVAVSTDSAGGAYVLERGSGSSVADVLYYPAGGGAPRIVVAQGAGMVTPTAMAVDGAGNIFIADPGVAGFGGGNILRFGADGSVNTAYATGLAGVNAMAVDGFDDLFLAIGGSFHNITEIYAGGTRSVVAGDGSVADSNGVPAINALFIDPSAVALGPNGTISIADAGTHYVYLIDSAGNIHIVAGNGTTATTSAGVATGTGLVTPDALAVDAAGDIYIADDSANIVYAVYSVISNGTNILPVIGTGTAGYTGDGGPSIAATINAPLAIALDGSSDLFVIDSGNNALREVSYPRTSTIGFGNVLIGTTAGPILQYLANAGNANLMFTTPFTTTDAHYAVSTNPTATTCTGTMAAGGVCSIGYTYTPTPPAGPAPAGQSNLFSNSYNSQQTVFFSTSGSYGYSTQSLPYTLLPETEMYGYPFPESLTLNLIYPFIDPTGAMSFSTGAKTLCTVAGPFSRTVVCNAPESGLNVGLYTVNFTYTTGDLNYSSVIGSTGLQITQAPLTVTPNNITRMYGQGNPTLTGSVVGAVNGDVFNVTYSTTATQFSPVGNYPITATLTPVGSASLSNYAVTYNVGTLTVTQASGAAGLVVTVNNATRPYGTPNPTFTGIVTGLVNGDSVTVSYSTAATQFSPVGGYAITATVSGAAAANYAVTVIPGTLTITPATTPLVVTVNNATRPYGTANPTFTDSVSGLIPGDSVTVTYLTAATQFSPVGGYPITAVVSGPSAASYAVTVIPGTLTVTPSAIPVVITVNNSSRSYGTANPPFTNSMAGALNGDSFVLNYSTPATVLSDVGNYSISATVSGPSVANYTTISVVPGTLAITPDATVTTVTTSASPVNQGTNITFTATVTFGAGLPVPATTVNFYNGATLLGTGTLNLSGVATFSTSSLTAGTYTIMAIYQATRDFASSSGTVGQVVNPGTFTLTATPPSQFIRGPGNTVYAVSVSSVQGFEGPVKLTCTGLPTDATCVFATPTVNLTIGGTASTTMTVVSTEADARLALPALQIPAGRTPGGLSPIAFAAVFPFGVGAFFAGVLRRKRGAQAGGARASRSPKIRLLLALFCTVGIVSLTGCACITSVYQVYTVPITGTDSSGMITQTTGTASNSPSVTLTVAQQ
jgi:sugar lactone lactonase YvrE